MIVNKTNRNAMAKIDSILIVIVCHSFVRQISFQTQMKLIN